MLSDIGGTALRVVASIVRDVVIDIALFNIGRGALQVATLGRYPRGSALERDAGWIQLAGLGVVVLTAVALAVYNNLFAIP